MPRITQAELLDKASSSPPDYDNLRCQKCELCHSSYRPFTFPLIRGHIVFIVSTPNEKEEADGSMGSGFEYTVIENHIAKPLGLAAKDFSVFSSVLCRPMDRRGKKVSPKKKQADMCRPFINHLLQRVKSPRKIIAMGATAAKAVLMRDVELKDEIGYVYKTNFGPVALTYSPGVMLQKSADEEGFKVGYLDVIREHVRRFVFDIKPQEFPSMEIV